MYYIYILYSAGSDKYYLGYSSDFQRRLRAHNTQEHFNTYTSKHRPWELVAVFEVGPVEAEAIRIERFIKKQKSRTLIKTMVESETLDGLLAQLVRVPDVRD